MKLRETIAASLRLLDRRDRRLLALAVAIQMSTSLLDLFGVLMIGIVSVLALSAVDGRPPPDTLTSALRSLGFDGLSDSVTIAVLALSAAALLLAKTAISPLIMGRVLKFLARREALVSSRLTRELLSRPLTFVQRHSSQETASALLQGANAATVVILGQMVALASEFTLLALFAVSMLIVNPVVAVGLIVFFGSVSVGMQYIQGNRATLFSKRRRRADVESLVSFQEVIGSYREITVSNRRSLYVDHLRRLRLQAAEASANSQVAAALPKYIAEAALVIGGFALAGTLFTTQSAAVAAGTFGLFLAAGTRVMPSLLRVQAAILAIRSGAGQADPTFTLANDLRDGVSDGSVSELTEGELARLLSCDHTGFEASITLRDVSFTYPGADVRALNSINLRVNAGQTIALVGRSGAGKSTLADVILGVLTPDSGCVEVGGTEPAAVVRRFPGAIAYVPQDVMLSNNTVRANVAFGLPADHVDDDLVWDALRRAHLADDIRNQPKKLDTEIGERGIRLSGGQRQRLGIARALFTKPRLLVLDEATSSLDAETELAITETLDELGKDVTRVIIAHRLSTVLNAEVVIYLENGVALTQGTFDEVRARIPALANQAALMGLRPI